MVQYGGERSCRRASALPAWRSGVFIRHTSGSGIGGLVDTTRRVVLILADISGYTRFMLENATAAVHAQMVITKLLEEIIREVEIPLQVKEIEGDAVFLYALKSDDDAEWDETRRLIGRKLLSFFDAFARGILAGSEFALCSCPSCQNIDRLKLKVVVHSGEAVFHKVGNFEEVSGVDVILAHRLLKNSIRADEYILMSEAAYRDIEIETSMDLSQGEERYEGFAPIRTYAFLKERLSEPNPEAVEHFYADRSRAFATGLRMLAKGYFGQLQILLGPQDKITYNNLGDLRITSISRAMLFARVVLLAPILVPLGAAIQAYRAFTRSTLATRRHRT